MRTTIVRILEDPYESMKVIADERRWQTAAWIIGAVAAPELILFAVLAKINGGLAGWAWPWAIVIPAALVVGTYVAAAYVISLACRLVKGNGDPLRHLAAWALTYPPTIYAFAVIILFHVLAGFVGGLGFIQMMVASAILMVVVFLYEVLILELGLGKVPFI